MVKIPKEIILIKIDELKEYGKNARTHTAEQVAQVAASIKEFGFTNPVLIDENNEIIAGHGRTASARSIGMTEVPAIRLEGLTDAQKRALRIADNKLALNSGWDNDLLSEELEVLKFEDFNIDVVGFSSEELDELLTEATKTMTDTQIAEDTAPEVDVVENMVQPGDVWQLGKHRLMCGDSTSVEDVRTLMDDDNADMWLTDPPYNIDYKGKGADKLRIKNDNMSDDAFYQLLARSYKAADAVLKPGGAFYIWHAATEGYNFHKAAIDAGWKVRQCLIWEKNAIALGRQDYQWKHEPCLYGWKDGASHHWYSDRKQTTILNFEKPCKNAEHPTMKPVALFAYLVENSSQPGDVVLDSFGGSGTTLIACEQLGRRCNMMELDPRYCSVIIARYEQLTGEKAIKIN